MVMPTISLIGKGTNLLAYIWPVETETCGYADNIMKPLGQCFH